MANESETTQLINQPTLPIMSTNKELNKAIIALTQQFEEIQNTQPEIAAPPIEGPANKAKRKGAT